MKLLTDLHLPWKELVANIHAILTAVTRGETLRASLRPASMRASVTAASTEAIAFNLQAQVKGSS